MFGIVDVSCEALGYMSRDLAQILLKIICIAEDVYSLWYLLSFKKGFKIGVCHQMSTFANYEK